MKRSVRRFAVPCLCAATFLTTGVLSQNPPTTTQPARHGPAKSPIEVWVRHAMPGKQHRLLDRMAGRWTTAVSYWMDPDAPPATSTGTCDRSWILGRRFLREEFDGGQLAMPFRGLGLYGYDRFDDKYTAVWLDTMSTAMMSHRGDYDEAVDAVNFIGHYSDPWTGRRKDSRGVTRFLGKDKHVLELYVRQDDGREFKLLEITYTRQPPEPAHDKPTSQRQPPPRPQR